MHYYNFNPADFNNSARHLTLVERAIYRDLLDMYYCTEQAIDGSNMKMLARRLLCKTEEHIKALNNVLDEFFTLDGRSKRYRNRRCEREIKNYRNKPNKNGHKDVTPDVTDSHSDVTQNVTPDNVTMTAAERQKKVRQERKQMTHDLVSIGVTVDKSLKVGELRALHAQHINDIKKHVTKIVTDSSSNDVTSTVTTGHNQCHENHAQNGAITKNQEPKTKNQLNTYNNSNNSPANEKFDVAFWQPSLTDIQPLVSAEVPVMPSMAQADFDKHLAKFKTYRINKAVQGECVATEAYCVDLFVSWIKREYIHEQRNKTATAKPASGSQTSVTDYSSLGKAPVADDSDIPAVFLQESVSSSASTPSTKRTRTNTVMLNGLPFATLPGMTTTETIAYIDEQYDAGETKDETYQRVLKELEAA